MQKHGDSIQTLRDSALAAQRASEIAADELFTQLVMTRSENVTMAAALDKERVAFAANAANRSEAVWKGRMVCCILPPSILKISNSFHQNLFVKGIYALHGYLWFVQYLAILRNEFNFPLKMYVEHKPKWNDFPFWFLRFAFLTIKYCEAWDEEGAGPGEYRAGPDQGRDAS